MRRRPSARLLILDADGRLLRFRFVHKAGALAGKDSGLRRAGPRRDLALGSGGNRTMGPRRRRIGLWSNFALSASWYFTAATTHTVALRSVPTSRSPTRTSPALPPGGAFLFGNRGWGVRMTGVRCAMTVPSIGLSARSTFGATRTASVGTLWLHCPFLAPRSTSKR